MITRQALSLHLNELLACDVYKDYAPNGIQVEGKETIQRLCTAVTASDEAISAAILNRADALLVHHGFFWRGEQAVVTGMKRHRLSKLLYHDINLLAYHLPLDCHPSLGNNACLAQRLSLESVQMHTINQVDNMLWSGRLSQEVTALELTHLITDKLGRTPLHIAGHERPIKTLAWCSGGAQDFIEQAHQLGVDAYLSGEVSERTYYQARELGIHYYAAGHHATERYGVQALGEYLSVHYQLEHVFIDSDNPV